MMGDQGVYRLKHGLNRIIGQLGRVEKIFRTDLAWWRIFMIRRIINGGEWIRTGGENICNVISKIEHYIELAFVINKIRLDNVVN